MLGTKVLTCVTLTCDTLHAHTYRVRHQMHKKNYVLSTSYGYQVHQKTRGISLKEHNGETELNVYSHEPADLPLTKGNDDKETTAMSTLTEKPDEEAEIFTNEAAADPDKEMNLTDDIAKSLNEETQIMKISFDEPGEETKL